MADLSNLKIKDTYQLLLQADASGNIQTLQGATPNPLIVNGNLRYVDGNQQADYYLKSDGTGNASWAQVTVSGDLYISAATMNDTVLQLHTTSGTTIEVPVSYWSTDGSGNYSNSGLTGNVGIGTATPNEKLTVVGAISATTDLYLGSPTHTASTITAHDTLTIKGNGTNDYLYLANDRLDMYMNGGQIVEMTPTAISFNANAQAVDFSVYSEDNTALIRTRAEKNIVRLVKHVSINKPTTWNWTNEQKQALAVSGTSVFYSGGTTGTNQNAIEAVGNVDITGDVIVRGTVSATTDLHIDGNTSIIGSVSANTAYVNYIMAKGDVQESNNTSTGSSLTIEGEFVTITNQDTQDDFLKLSDNRFSFYFDTGEAVSFYGPTHSTPGFQFNTSSKNLGFTIYNNSGVPYFQGAGGAGTGSIRIRNHLQIGPMSSISDADSQNWGLAVTGSSLFYSGGTNANDHAIVAHGKISGSTDLTIGRDIIVGNDIYFADNGQAVFGDGKDLKIYHSGSHSIIQEAGVGNLLLKGGVIKIMGTTTGDDCAVFTENAGAELYYDDSNKFTTTNTGVNITGNLSSSATVSGATLQGMRAFPNPNLTDHSHMGDVVYLGQGDESTTGGNLYCYTGSTWVLADADVPNLSKGLLAIALGSVPATEGMLIKGYYTCTYDVGTQSNPLYLSATAGRVTDSAPSSSGQFVRITGYVIDSTNGQMWFDPDKTWVELS